MSALAVIPSTNAEVYRASTDAAGLCREIVLQTAMTIQNRKYVKVEGWQAIAIAHGCTAGARDVEAIEGGVRAIGEIRRMSDGALLATAEGFVGEDEPTWYGGETVSYGKKKVLPKRPDYAIRAMAQTRAISRACRSAFAHVVVLIDSNLSTTPAEEVPMGGFDNDGPALRVVKPEDVEQPATKTTPKPTLKERADKVERALRAADTTDKLRKTYELASGLCADLDLKDPERLAELTALYEQRFDELETAKPDLGIGDDEVPEFY